MQKNILKLNLKSNKKHVYNFRKIRYIISKCFSLDRVLISKKTKKGIKRINYQNSLNFLGSNRNIQGIFCGVPFLK